MNMGVGDIVNVLYLVYSAVRSLIQFIFELTITQGSPELALKFADATTLLVTITAVWIILEFTTSLKKVVRIVVIIGWVLLIVSMLISLAT